MHVEHFPFMSQMVPDPHRLGKTEEIRNLAFVLSRQTQHQLQTPGQSAPPGRQRLLSEERLQSSERARGRTLKALLASAGPS